MALTYLEGEMITDGDIDVVNSPIFKERTNEKSRQNGSLRSEFENRFTHISLDGIVLEALLEGYQLFQDQKGTFGNLESRNTFIRQLNRLFPNFTSPKKLGEILSDNTLPTVQPKHIVVMGGPVEEMQGRVQSCVEFIMNHLAIQKSPRIITTGGKTAHYPGGTEAGYLATKIGMQLERIGISKPIHQIDDVQNIGETMSALNKRFKNGAEVTLVTTDYDTLRIGLTAQHQLNARIARDVIGAPSIYFNEDSQSMERIWSPDSWWLTEEGWKATIYTVKRLIAGRGGEKQFL